MSWLCWKARPNTGIPVLAGWRGAYDECVISLDLDIPGQSAMPSTSIFGEGLPQVTAEEFRCTDNGCHQCMDIKKNRYQREWGGNGNPQNLDYSETSSVFGACGCPFLPFVEATWNPPRIDCIATGYLSSGWLTVENAFKWDLAAVPGASKTIET